MSENETKNAQISNTQFCSRCGQPFTDAANPGVYIGDTSRGYFVPRGLVHRDCLGIDSLAVVARDFYSRANLKNENAGVGYEAEIQQLTRHIKHLAENAASADQKLDQLKERQAKTIRDIKALPIVHLGLIERDSVLHILQNLNTNHP